MTLPRSSIRSTTSTIIVSWRTSTLWSISTSLTIKKSSRKLHSITVESYLSKGSCSSEQPGRKNSINSQEGAQYHQQLSLKTLTVINWFISRANLIIYLQFLWLKSTCQKSIIRNRQLSSSERCAFTQLLNFGVIQIFESISKNMSKKKAV